jgi:hypothetical protein
MRRGRGRWLGYGRTWRRGGRRGRLGGRLRLRLSGFGLLLLRQLDRAILLGAHANRQAQRKRRDDRAGQQEMLRSCHKSLPFDLSKTRFSRTGKHSGPAAK